MASSPVPESSYLLASARIMLRLLTFYYNYKLSLLILKLNDQTTTLKSLLSLCYFAWNALFLYIFIANSLTFFECLLKCHLNDAVLTSVFNMAV